MELERIAALLAVLAVAAPARLQGQEFEAPAAVVQRIRAAEGAVPDVEGGPLTPSAGVLGGHDTGLAAAGYDIWANNCHTQANLFTAHAQGAGADGGALVCRGNPEDSPMYHTANWSTAGGQTCILNYGERCCFDPTGSPPDLSAGRARQCAQWACGAQYKPDETRALPPGMLVEMPGPHVCAFEAAGGPVNTMRGTAVDALVDHARTGARTVRVPPSASHPGGFDLTFTSDRLEPCLKCCGERAGLWSGNSAASVTRNLAQGREANFRRQCASACRASFGAGQGE